MCNGAFLIFIQFITKQYRYMYMIKSVLIIWLNIHARDCSFFTVQSSIMSPWVIFSVGSASIAVSLKLNKND